MWFFALYHDGVYVIAIFCGFFLREIHAGIFAQGKEQIGDTKAGSPITLLIIVNINNFGRTERNLG